jgi:hypothetical protein
VAGIADVYLAAAEASLAGNTGAPDLTHAIEACAAAKSYAGKARIFRPRALLIEGRLAMLRGRRARAESQWREALARATDLQMPLEQGLALAALAGIDSDPAKRADCARRSAALLRDIGAAPWRSSAFISTTPAAAPSLAHA